MGKVVIQAVDGVLVGGGHAAEQAVLRQQVPELFAQVGVVGNLLGDDVGCARQGVLRRLHALFRVDVTGGLGQWVGTIRGLGEQEQGQRLQALFLCSGGPGAALLLVGAVQILHLCQGPGGVDGGGQLLRQLALVLDGFFHRLPALLQAPEVLQPLLQGAEGGVVHGAVEFLAVAGDEGDGVALVQQGDDVFHVAQGLVQLPGQQLGDSRHRDGSPFRKL